MIVPVRKMAGSRQQARRQCSIVGAAFPTGGHCCWPFQCCEIGAPKLGRAEGDPPVIHVALCLNRSKDVLPYSNAKEPPCCSAGASRRDGRRKTGWLRTRPGAYARASPGDSASGSLGQVGDDCTHIQGRRQSPGMCRSPPQDLRSIATAMGGSRRSLGDCLSDRLARGRRGSCVAGRQAVPRGYPRTSASVSGRWSQRARARQASGGAFPR